MTFVRARLALERLPARSTLVIRLRAGEALENLPRSLAELGYRVISLSADDDDPASEVHRLVIAKP